VPEEFAAAYRAAYERALAAQSEQTHRRVEDDDTDEVPRRPGRLRVGTHRDHTAGDHTTEQPVPVPTGPVAPTRSRPRWLVPLLLVVLVALLLLGAYAVGRVFAGQVEGGRASQEAPAPGTTPWRGRVEPVAHVEAEVACTSAPGTDAGGAKVDYVPANMTDGKPETTWRCDGNAVGRKIRLVLDGPTPIGEVGLVPGYAKTDERDRSDRYAENNRITKVRWTIGGTVVEQTMTPDPKDRSMRLLRVPRTTVRSVTLEILALEQGPRNTTAISEVRLGEAG
jgi:hypothetical protein